VAAGGEPLDLVRLRRQRFERLQGEMARAEVEVCVLAGTSAVTYAAGLLDAPVDAATAAWYRPIVVAVAGADHPYVFAPDPSVLPPELPADHIHPGLWAFGSAGAETLLTAAAEVAGDAVHRIALDEWSGDLPSGPGAPTVVDAAPVLAAARLVKTVDEVECLRRAQRINELAIADIEPLVLPGVRQSELTGRFFARALALGADGWALDPIWQVMPAPGAPAPATVHGDLAFPLASSDRILRRGDLVWVDTGLVHHGYVSDFGRTWLVDPAPRPSPALLDSYHRWRAILEAVLAVVGPGATGADLVAAACRANGGRRPWPAHFYLAHGIGLDSAEAPLIGTDRGPAADDAVVLVPGTVIVLEPETWTPGVGGYRGEEMLVVTDDGYRLLSDHHDWPFQ
jgi:Xaa-Pro aminopeptidase